MMELTEEEFQQIGQQYCTEILMRLPEQFKEAFYQKKYGTAKYIYDTAIRVAECMNIPKEVRMQLFGDKQDERHIIEGMFPEALADNAYEYCTIKLYQGYEHESFRRFGEPPRYYPQPRYPVPGYKKE